jgi:hypothetical protein
MAATLERLDALCAAKTPGKQGIRPSVTVSLGG